MIRFRETNDLDEVNEGVGATDAEAARSDSAQAEPDPSSPLQSSPLRSSPEQFSPEQSSSQQASSEPIGRALTSSDQDDNQTLGVMSSALTEHHTTSDTPPSDSQELPRSYASQNQTDPWQAVAWETVAWEAGAGERVAGETVSEQPVVDQAVSERTVYGQTVLGQAVLSQMPLSKSTPSVIPLRMPSESKVPQSAGSPSQAPSGRASSSFAPWSNADPDDVLTQQVSYYELSPYHGGWDKVHWDRITLGALVLGSVVFWAWGQHHNAELWRSRAQLNQLAEQSNVAALGAQPETVAWAALPQPAPPTQGASANFVEPLPGSTVGATISVRGVVTGVAEGKHLWLITRRDPRQGFWPKERIVPDAEGRFEQTTWDYGPDGRLSICVLETTAAETQRFDEWLSVGDREDEWPSVQPMSSSSILGCNDVTLSKRRAE